MDSVLGGLCDFLFQESGRDKRNTGMMDIASRSDWGPDISLDNWVLHGYRVAPVGPHFRPTALQPTVTGAEQRVGLAPQPYVSTTEVLLGDA